MSGVLKFYNGTEDIVIGGNKASIDVSPAAPENPKLGDLWFDTSESEIEKAFDIDSMPVEGSEALITSGGVFEGLSGKIEIVKLWENASPTSAFAAQTVTLELSDYDLIRIVTNAKYATAEGTETICEAVSGEGEVGKSFVLQNVETSSNTAYRAQIFLRMVTVNLNDITFSDATEGSNQRYQTTNSKLIPLRIYGIKGVN